VIGTLIIVGMAALTLWALAIATRHNNEDSGNYETQFPRDHSGTENRE